MTTRIRHPGGPKTPGSTVAAWVRLPEEQREIFLRLFPGPFLQAARILLSGTRSEFRRALARPEVLKAIEEASAIVSASNDRNRDRLALPINLFAMMVHSSRVPNAKAKARALADAHSRLKKAALAAGKKLRAVGLVKEAEALLGDVDDILIGLRGRAVAVSSYNSPKKRGPGRDESAEEFLVYWRNLPMPQRSWGKRIRLGTILYSVVRDWRGSEDSFAARLRRVGRSRLPATRKDWKALVREARAGRIPGVEVKGG